MTYFFIALGALLLWIWFDLFVRTAGLGITAAWPGASGLHPLPTVRVRFNSLYAKILNSGTSFGAVTIRTTIHVKGGRDSLTPSRLAHEIRHVLRTAEVGTYTYLWQYLTDSGFANAEEAEAERYNRAYTHDATIQSAWRRFTGRV